MLQHFKASQRLASEIKFTVKNGAMWLYNTVAPLHHVQDIFVNV